MRDRKLRQRLGDIPIPDYEEEAYLQTLKAAGKINLHPERQRVSGREFFLGQLPFISRKVWAAKLILTAFLILGILETGVAPDQRTWPLLSVSAPLLCLANVNELCDICRPGMREILKAARHSPGEMLLVRLLVFGFLDLSVCLTGAVLAADLTAGLLWRAVLYFAAPFSVMCAGCMIVINRCRDENALWYCTAWGGFLIAAVSMLRASAVPVYEADRLFGWGTAAAAGIVVTVLEINRLLKSMGGMRHEINYGTAD